MPIPGGSRNFMMETWNENASRRLVALKKIWKYSITKNGTGRAGKGLRDAFRNTSYCKFYSNDLFLIIFQEAKKLQRILKNESAINLTHERFHRRNNLLE